MKKLVLSLLAVSTMLFAGGDVVPAGNVTILPIQEDRKLTYVGVAGVMNETHTTGNHDLFGHTGGEFTNSGLVLLTGYNLSDNPIWNYALEGRLGSSFWMEDSEDVTTTFAGLYVRGNYRASQVFQVYGALGGSVVDIDGDRTKGEAYGGLSGILGVELIAENYPVAFFIDYTWNAIDADIGYFTEDVSFDTAAIGVRYKF